MSRDQESILHDLPAASCLLMQPAKASFYCTKGTMAINPVAHPHSQKHVEPSEPQAEAPD